MGTLSSGAEYLWSTKRILVKRCLFQLQIRPKYILMLRCNLKELKAHLYKLSYVEEGICSAALR